MILPMGTTKSNYSSHVYIFLGSLVVLGNLIWLFPTLTLLRSNINIVEERTIEIALSRIKLFLENNILGLQVSSQYIIPDLEAKENSLVLQNVLKGDNVKAVSLTDPSGKEIIKFDKFKPTNLLTYENISTRHNFMEAITTRRPAWSSVTISANLEPHIIASVPFYTSDEALAGVISAEFNVNEMFKDVGSIKLAQTGKLYIVDSEGVLISDPDTSLVLKNPGYMSRRIVIDTLQAKQTTSSLDDRYTYKNEKGVRVLSAGGYVSGPQFLVILEENRSDVFKAINQIKIYATLISVLGVIVLLALRSINRRLINTNKAVSLRIRQQAFVADFSRSAITESNVQVFTQDGVSKIRASLGVDYVSILELLPDGKALRLVIGAGWREGMLGNTIVEAGKNSQVEYTFLSDEPIVVTDFKVEQRFQAPPHLAEHGITSGVSVVIPKNTGKPYGVLSVYSIKRRTFSSQDVSFIQSVAGIIAQKIEKKEAEEKMTHTINELTKINKITIERELRMIELKKEILQLTEKLNPKS
ncbi:MAG: GAF domain-containing protein [bacterium]|nr:GAF domain-containing protein [bacterium]